MCYRASGHFLRIKGIVYLTMLNFFSNVALGLNDEEALDAIESTFKQFNTFLDLMQEKGYVTMLVQNS